MTDVNVELLWDLLLVSNITAMNNTRQIANKQIKVLCNEYLKKTKDKKTIISILNIKMSKDRVAVVIKAYNEMIK